MAEKPSELNRNYEAWRGTQEHLVEIASIVRDEMKRAEKAAKENALAEIRQSSSESKAEAESQLRRRDGLTLDAPLTPEQQAELHQFNAAVDAYDERQKESREEAIGRANRLKFGYRDKAGRFKSDQRPEFLKTTPSSVVGVEMTGTIVFQPLASVTVRIQNYPWEAVSVNVHGDDPDWVSSAFMPLDAAMTARQPRHVVLLRNQATRTFVGLALWLLLIGPTADLFERFGADRLHSIPVSLVIAALIALVFQHLTRPFLLTGRQPSALREIAWATIPVLAGTLLSFLLDLVVTRLK